MPSGFSHLPHNFSASRLHYISAGYRGGCLTLAPYVRSGSYARVCVRSDHLGHLALSANPRTSRAPSTCALCACMHACSSPPARERAGVRVCISIHSPTIHLFSR